MSSGRHGQWKLVEQGADALVVRRLPGIKMADVATAPVVAGAGPDGPGWCAPTSVHEDGVGLVVTRPWVAGESLADRLGRGRLDPGEAEGIIAGLSDVIGKAHGRGLHHGNLTAANVILTDEGPVLVDAGLRELVAGVPLDDLHELARLGRMLGAGAGAVERRRPVARFVACCLAGGAAVAVAAAVVAVGGRRSPPGAALRPAPVADVTTVTGPPDRSGRYRLGLAGDQLVVGDWDCRGVDLPALYRPSTGQVFLFDSWPPPGASLRSRPAVVGGLRHGVALVVHRQCDSVAVVARAAPTVHQSAGGR
ncbi:MAG TPA: hypothetical protein VFH45_13485 [Acidimicrobiales bacterium]|nr:hypothetical protein [Acidimicrobiales bacterium]